MSLATAPHRGLGLEVHCQRVVLLYPSDEGDVAALRGIDLDIEPGEALAILGPSGSGKSSLLALLAGLIKPSSGRVRLGDRDLGQMTGRELARMHASSVSLVLQDPTRNLLPYASAIQNVEFAQRLGKARAGTQVRPARQLLEQLGLSELGSRAVASLSGGEQQRVAIAASISLGPELLLVDEPTNQLDGDNRDVVLELLLGVNRELGTTLVCVTHDQAVADALPRTVNIRDGLVGAEGRLGQTYAVVSREGTIDLPPDVLEVLPPGTLVKVVRRGQGAELINRDLDESGETVSL
ncbi:MAG TPA: ATP-binding cassette domain-containing protein [Candidatus Dormibacteraeota bacterium]|nr:ATP-binding cassette domain-containing protein [Candidatus Dormibacteraeota bacterium]